MKLVVQNLSISYRRMNERMLKSFVEIEFELLSITKRSEVQYFEFDF